MTVRFFYCLSISKKAPVEVSLIGGRTMRAAKLSLPVYPGKTGRLGGSF